MEQQTPVPSPQEEEIDIIALLKKVWNGRKTIFIALGVGTILGLFVALGTTKKYTVSTVMVPQVASGSAMKSSLGGLAALAGINMDMTQNPDLSPVIYPQIISSVPFLLEMMNTPIKFEEVNQPVSLIDYVNVYQKKTVLGTVAKYTIGLPGVIMTAIKGETKMVAVPSGENKLISLTSDQYQMLRAMDKIISLNVDTKQGYLTLTVNLSEPLAAAQFAQKAMELLQKEITKFKIEKAQAELNFIQGRYDVAKAEMEKAQVDLATNTDRSRFFTSELSSISTDRIQTRYNIAFTVFQQMATQLEQAKIQVAKDTPVFTVVQPVTIPSPVDGKPNKKMILLIWIFLGGIAGVIIVFAKQFLVDLKNKWNKTEEKISTIEEKDITNTPSPENIEIKTQKENN
jgi:hypothetical protein